MTNRSASQPRRGYILLVVLFVLALAAATVAGICRMSLEKAILAGRAEADLRHRWAAVSCRQVLLPKAGELFRDSTNSGSEIRTTVALGGRPYTLVFGDEQAKVNVNLLYAQSGLSGAERDVRTIAGITGGSVAVELRPIPGVGKRFGSLDAADEDPRAFESFDQVFRHTPPALLVAPHGKHGSLTSRLTCWGDGSLHLRKASNESVRASLSRYLTSAEISRLLDARTKNPKGTVAEVLDVLDLPLARRDPVESILTDESFCHSLWIISDSGDRIGYDLAVAEGAAMTQFSW